jgi:oxidase EvaA
MHAPKSLAEGFLRSCFALEQNHGARASLATVREWLESERRTAIMRVTRIPFRRMDSWRFSREGPLRLAHDSGRFFSVEGARFRDRSTGVEWDQPVLNQPEIGLLGFLMAVFDGVPHFLVQAKWEPGNPALQLSPTVQATHSNYSRTHGGRAQPYLEHFVPAQGDTTVFDFLMPEHGAFFRRKWNRNMVVRVGEDLPVLERFAWLTLGQLKTLLAEDDVVHMDSRSILAGLSLGADGAGDQLVSALDLDGRAAALARSASTVDGLAELESWLSGTSIDIEPRPLDGLAGWTLEDDELRPEAGSSGGFSVIGIEVEANRREISRWTQPMIAPTAAGFLGLLLGHHDGSLSLLVEARPEPGHDGTAHVFPTVTTADPEQSALAAYFSAPKPGELSLSARNLDEGGRFYHCVHNYRIVELPRSRLDTIPTTHRWLTLGQLTELAKRGRVSMELRNLLAALPVSSR